MTLATSDQINSWVEKFDAMEMIMIWSTMQKENMKQERIFLYFSLYQAAIFIIHLQNQGSDMLQRPWIRNCWLVCSIYEDDAQWLPAINVRRGLSASSFTLWLIKVTTYSMKAVSQRTVIGPLLAVQTLLLIPLVLEQHCC